MNIQRTDFKAIGYLITFTLTTYFMGFAYKYLIPNPGLLMRLIMVFTGFVVIYLIARLFYGDPFGKIKSSTSYSTSLIHILILMLPLYAYSVVAMFILSTKRFYIMGKPGFVEVWNPFLPLYALIFWAICGIMVAYFYHAVTYELFGKSNRFVGILSATILFALNYNQPFLTSFWSIEDILFFGLLFAYSYSVKKNPLALLSAYLLSEVPLWWCVLAPFGENVFALYFIGRVVISIIALVIFAYRGLRMKRERVEGGK